MSDATRVGFAIGTGRCGTLFLHQLLEIEPCIASSHERNPLNEAFHRYCKWYDLPVDDEGFLSAKQVEIDSDFIDNTFSFEASPHLSISVKELYERFQAKFICLLRRPDKVVTSFAHKGFYRKPYVQRDENVAIGCQYPETEKFEYSLARIAPVGSYFSEWNQLTHIGKNAWFWKAYNQKVFEILKSIPLEHFRVVKIEEFDYDKYVEMADFLGFQPRVSRRTFLGLADSKPHSFVNKRDIDDWSPQEIAEFESQVKELSMELGYEYRIEKLIEEAKARPKQTTVKRKQGPHFWNLRRSSARLLREFARLIDCGTKVPKVRKQSGTR